MSIFYFHFILSRSDLVAFVFISYLMSWCLSFVSTAWGCSSRRLTTFLCSANVCFLTLTFSRTLDISASLFSLVRIVSILECLSTNVKCVSVS